MLADSFEELVKNKAKKQTSKSLAKHAESFGLNTPDLLRAFKIGSWDAMIFDMARGLNLIYYSSHDHRKTLIDKWLKEGL